MSQPTKNALVPIKPRGLIPRPGSARYDLVSDLTTFKSREDVRERLPEILGKALALIWIDREFADLFARDPQGTLEREGILYPIMLSSNSRNPELIDLESSYMNDAQTRISS